MGLAITASQSYLSKNADIVKAFTEASLQGWADAKNDPKAASESMIEQFPSAGTVPQITAEVKVDVGLLCSAEGSTHMGPVSDAVWAQTADLLKETDLLPAKTDVSTLVAQKYAGTTFPKC